MLQVRGSEVAPVHSNFFVELGIVRRGIDLLVIEDFACNCADDAADDGSRYRPGRPRDRADRRACQSARQARFGLVFPTTARACLHLLACSGHDVNRRNKRAAETCSIALAYARAAGQAELLQCLSEWVDLVM
jgi:hypothetical protein